jgi:general stress protein 26
MFNLRNKEKFPKLVPFFESLGNEFLILFTTNTSSSKVDHIKNRSAVSIYYHIPESWKGVMFGGDIEIVKDGELKKKLWHDDWIKYYPKGYDDPDHTILQINPRVAKGWAENRTFKIDLGDAP